MVSSDPRERICSARAVCRWVAVASAAEPKCKQKLAAADEHAEKTRQATAQAQQEYFKKQAEQRRQQAGPGAVEKLGGLEFASYLTEEA